MATGARLLGSLSIVVLQEGCRHLTCLLSGAWQVHLEALLPQRSLEPLDRGLLVGPMWRADGGLDAQAQQKAHQGRGEVAPAGAADTPGVPIKGEPARQAVLLEEVGHRLKHGLGVEIAAHVAFEPDGVARVYKIGTLDHPAFVCPVDRQVRC
jgi:hypothetical protein